MFDLFRNKKMTSSVEEVITLVKHRHTRYSETSTTFHRCLIDVSGKLCWLTHEKKTPLTEKKYALPDGATTFLSFGRFFRAMPRFNHFNRTQGQFQPYGGKEYPCPCPFVLVCPFVPGFIALPSIGTSQGQTGFLMCDHRLNSRNTVHFDANIFEHGCLNLILNPSLV